VCDDKDNNCAGGIDEGLPLITWYFDNDKDGYGYAGSWQEKCNEPAPAEDWVEDNTDCDDNDIEIYPGGPPVRVTGTGATEYFDTIWYSYHDPDTVDGDVMQCKAGMLNDESLTFHRDITVKIEGGYDCGYSSDTGVTIINGDMTINDGALIIQGGTLELQ
jgi:hypothetical protein